MGKLHSATVAFGYTVVGDCSTNKITATVFSELSVITFEKLALKMGTR